MKNFLSWFSAAIFIIILVQACTEDELPSEEYLSEPACGQSYEKKVFPFQVVGFYPYYRRDMLPVSRIPWENITRIVYAFAIPEADGRLNTTNLFGISELVAAAHENGVEVYVSVGGGGSGSANFPLIATDPKAVQKLADEIRHYLFSNCLDGVDLDWENWSGALTNTVNVIESEAYVELVKMLEEDIAPFGIEISADLSASDWGGKHILDEAFMHVDHLQVMAYDFSGPWSAPGPHSAYEDAIGSGSEITSTGLAYWVNYRKWPKEKILLGVPFYGRDFDVQQGRGISYMEILEKYPEAWAHDSVANIYYDGMATVKQKSQYVKENNFAGIMIWELGQDTPADSLSLLKVIHETLTF